MLLFNFIFIKEFLSFCLNLELCLGIFANANEIKPQHNLNSRLSIKVVEELPNNDNGIKFTHFENDFDASFKKRNKHVNVHPTSFSGPKQLEQLKESCFTYLDEKYKYKFCPFNNFTQEEILSGQESFKTVLGIWGEWIIENNKFKAMHFVKGMKCGSETERNVKINLACGTYDHLLTIMEPIKCKYEGLFETPLVCGSGAMLVYPRLSKELQTKWDQLETEKHNDILTKKGYEKEMNDLFIEAGYVLSTDLKDQLNNQLTSVTSECEQIKKFMEEKLEKLEAEMAAKDDLIQSLRGQLHAQIDL